MSIRSTLLLLVVSLSAGAQELPLTHFTTGGQGAPLPSASVQKIVQDDQGYIWLAFYSTGIARYDGHRMETYGIADGIADPTVREIAEDATHHLWIGSEAGLVVSAKPLNAYAPGERVRFVANVGDVTLARSRMRRNCVVASRDGSVWVGTQNGIERYRFEGSRLSTEKIDTPAGVQAMLVRRDGSVLASLLDNQIIVAGKGPLTKLASGAGALLEAPDGTIWGGSNDGSVWRLENGVAHVINHDLAERIVALLITHDGDLWAASLGKGALRIAPRNPQNHLVITRANGLLGETLWTLFEDREGNLWLGQNGGASRLRKGYRSFVAYTESSTPALPDSSTFAVVPSWRGAMWVGTGAGLASIANDRTETITVANGLDSNQIYSLAVDGDARLWIGTSAGLACLSLPGHEPRAITTAKRTNVSVRGTTYVLSALGLSTTYGVRHLGSVMCFAGAWGAACYANETWYRFGVRSGLPPAGATSVTVGAHGHLWVGSTDHGLYRSRAPLAKALAG